MKKTMKAVAALMLLTVTIFAIGCTKSDDPNNGGDNNGGNNGGGNQSHHEYVDLGLPSGTLWATCNVGANTPYEYGDYFAWGETEPKSAYYLDIYLYYNGTSLTKYTSNDGLNILQSGDDAATVNWGNGWRTPIKEQWQELIDNTTSAWTTKNDVYGRVFYGNGQSLFLPATGYRSGTSVSYVGSSGHYWSSSLKTDNPRIAWRFDFYSSNTDVYHGYREDGISVRAVRDN